MGPEKDSNKLVPFILCQSDVRQFPFIGGGHWEAFPLPTHKYTCPLFPYLESPQTDSRGGLSSCRLQFMCKKGWQISESCAWRMGPSTVTAPGLAHGAAASRDSCREGAFPLEQTCCETFPPSLRALPHLILPPDCYSHGINLF